MGIIGTVWERRGRTYPGEPASSHSSFWARFMAAPTRSGVNVNEHTALNIATVWACVRAISEDVAKLPIKTYRKEADGSRTVLPNHEVTYAFNVAPNPEMSAMVFRETTVAHSLLWGNGYAEIEWLNNGRMRYLWPLEPDRTWPDRRRDPDKSLVYVYEGERGRKVLSPEDVFHVRGLGYDGLVGYSVVHMARESMGLAMAAETFGASFFGNSATPSGVLEHPGKLSDKAYENLKKSWNDMHGGPANAGRPAILEGGMKWHQITIPQKDAQFLETRQFQVAEICRWFRMKPHKIADLSRATFSNIEHESLDYVVDTLMGWMVRLEQEIRRKLIVRTEGSVYAEHLVAGLLRGDLKSRYEAYAIGRQWGWLSPDDVRELENMNPLPESQGKLYLVPANMTTPKRMENPPEPAPALPAGGGGDAEGGGRGDEQRCRVAPQVRTLVADELRREVREGGGAESERPGADRGNLVRAVLAAHRPLPAGAIRSLLKVEVDKARRAANKGELRTWAGDFYRQQPDYVRGAVWPVLEALESTLAAVAGEGEARKWAAEYSAEMAARHSDRSRRELAAAAEANTLPALLASWEGERAESEAGEELERLAGTLAPPGQGASS